MNSCSCNQSAKSFKSAGYCGTILTFSNLLWDPQCLFPTCHDYQRLYEVTEGGLLGQRRDEYKRA